MAVVVLTAHVWSRPVRPLFDGFGTHSTYRWVKAPSDWAEENQQPAGGEFAVQLGAEGSKASTGTTADSQVVVELPDGSMPAHDTDTGAMVTMTPHDAGTLGPLPVGLAVQSNAYRVTIAYEPSKAGITGLARAGSVALVGAGPADTLLFSPDGQRWERREARPYGESHGLSAPLESTGWFLLASPPTASSGSGSPISLLLIGAVAVVPLGLFWLLGGRRRTRSKPQRSRHAVKSTRSPTKAKPRKRRKRPPKGRRR